MTRYEIEPGVFRDNVVELSSEEAVERAWQTYQSHAVQLSDDPTLLHDRKFNEEMAKLHERWRRLFLLREPM